MDRQLHKHVCTLVAYKAMPRGAAALSDENTSNRVKLSMEVNK